jgi:gliding motility-associated-like protein
LPFGNETISNYELWTLDETTNFFYLSDSFIPQKTETKIKDFSINIFDRNGTVVYQSNSPDFIWDGSFNENILHKGIYNYIVSLL